MQLVNYNIFDILSYIRNGTSLVCFGAGKALDTFCKIFETYNIENYIAAIIDNNPALWKQSRIIKKKEILIDSVENILERKNKDIIIVITSQYFQAIYEVLKKFDEKKNTEVCFYGFLIDRYSDWKLENGFMEYISESCDQIKIPKVIHYCWFGKKTIPDKYKVWMKSWKQYCPNYEIIEWNEDNYDVMKNQYMAQAYNEKKWGFVPDYARLDIIYQHGGIYLDTDVQLVKNLDELLYQEAFCGFQDEYNIALGLGFGSVRGNIVIKQLLKRYNDLLFDSGNMISSPVFQTNSLIELGLIPNGKYQKLRNITVYPKVCFSPMNHYNREIKMNSKTFSIHHFDGSWVNCNEKNEWNDFKKIYVLFKNNT